MFPLLAAALPAIASVGAGVASWLGGREANATNVRMAREQMDFQERMANSAAQRGVKDYAAAGLNPALAYDRPASSPGGAMARVEDAVSKGVSSALQTKALLQSMKIAADQSNADLLVKQSVAEKNIQETAFTMQETQRSMWQHRLGEQEFGFRAAQQPFEQRLKAARALIEEYGVAGARNISAMENRLGELSPQIRFWLGNARTATGALNPFNLFTPRR